MRSRASQGLFTLLYAAVFVWMGFSSGGSHLLVSTPVENCALLPVEKCAV